MICQPQKLKASFEHRLALSSPYEFALWLDQQGLQPTRHAHSKGDHMKSFRTLDLAIEFYDLFKHSTIKGNLRDQLLRAASSISFNLAEGNAKRTEREKKRYDHTAYASVQECKTILRLC